MSVVIAETPPLTEGLATSGVVLFVVLVTWLVIDQVVGRAIKRSVARILEEDDVRADERAKRILTLWSVGRLVIVIVLIVVAILLLFGVWGIPMTPFLAVGSVLGVALGFGAQDLVKDVIAGVFIVAENQYGIDDVVEIADTTGRVESIRLRTTVLRDLDGNVHHVPNGSITVASNYTQEYAQVVVDLGVAYEVDVDEVMAVIVDEGNRFYEDPEWQLAFLDAPELLGVEQLGESSVIVRIVLKVRPGQRWAARREFLRRIKRRFDEEGIEIPFPHITIVRRSPPRANHHA